MSQKSPSPLGEGGGEGGETVSPPTGEGRGEGGETVSPPTGEGHRRTIRRWFKSTSNRTFIAWPVALYAVEWLLHRGPPPIHVWALPLLAWGYLQYRLVGVYRTREGGGGPGLSVPPERLVTTGPYRWTRNPMYTGHIVYFTGVALALGSWIAAAVLAAHLFWFDRRVKEDEARLATLFGEPYRDYCRRVKRWIPGVL